MLAAVAGNARRETSTALCACYCTCLHTLQTSVNMLSTLYHIVWYVDVLSLMCVTMYNLFVVMILVSADMLSLLHHNVCYVVQIMVRQCVGCGGVRD
jgi:hypothetical protein